MWRKPASTDSLPHNGDRKLWHDREKRVRIGLSRINKRYTERSTLKQQQRTNEYSGGPVEHVEYPSRSLPLPFRRPSNSGESKLTGNDTVQDQMYRVYGQTSYAYQNQRRRCVREWKWRQSMMWDRPDSSISEAHEERFFALHASIGDAITIPNPARSRNRESQPMHDKHCRSATNP